MLFLRTFLALPRWAHGLLTIAALALGFMIWLHRHDRAVIREHEATIAAQTKELVEQTTKAAASASVKVREDANDKLRKSRAAASVSDDPLVAGRKELKP